MSAPKAPVSVLLSLTIAPLDLTIVVIYLAAVVSLGLWIGRGQRTLADFLLGGRDLPWWALLGSIVATETSTATFLSVPGIAFAAGGDLRFLQLAMGYIVGRVLVVLILLPRYFGGDLYTAYELLDRRFGGGTKQLASVLFLAGRNLGDGLRLYLTAIALEKVTGLSLNLCIILIGTATIVYTVFGGMRSVVWNDCLQFVLYMIGGVVMAALIPRGLSGGWDTVSAFAQEHDKWQVFDWGFDLSDPFCFWSGFIGGLFLTMGTHGTDQMLVQRYLCARSGRDAGKALVLSGVVVFVQFALFLVIGIELAAHYDAFPPSAPIEGDKAVATFMVERLPTGLLGLLLAAIFAAAMSTLSSSLNSSAASALNDLYLPTRAQPIEPAQQVRLSRILTMAFGVLQIGIGIGAQYSRSVVQDALTVAGFVAGILLGVFLLGVSNRRANATAAMLGMLAGLAATAFAFFGTDLAWPWLPVVGSLTTLGIGTLVGFVER